MKEIKKPNTASSSSAKKKLKFKPKASGSTASKDKKMSKKKVLNSILIVFLSLVLISGLCVFFILVNVLKDAPDVTKAFKSEGNTKILDKNGDVYTEVGAENRENITYDQLPQTVVDAFLSIEDSRFFTHNGFDLPRFISSAVNNLRSGSLGQGGSTLTMQMVDNARLQLEPEYNDLTASSIERIERKIQEIFMSMDAENKYTKEEILVNYLNKVNFGYTARGIQKGAQYYFGKDVSQLNLSESAFLAGVVNAPNLYNPYKGTQWLSNREDWFDFYEQSVERRDATLWQMFNHGYITEEEYKLTKSTELAFQLNGHDKFHADSSDAVLALVNAEMQEKYNINIYTDSCVVYTSIDPDAQALADQITNGEIITFPNDDNYNIAFSLMNNRTGEITAIGPGRGFDLNDTSAINEATNIRSTGSTIKPILDYAPAFDYLGYATSHVFRDQPIDYGTGTPLGNADGKYRGDITFADTVGNSYNTTAVQTFIDLTNKWGQDNIINYLNTVGITSVNKNNFAPQIAIGGDALTASPVSLAGAYGIFANEGKYIEPHVVTKVEFPDDPDKEAIHPNYEPVQTISTQAAYLMSDILKQAININWFMSQRNAFGSVSYPVYGKTGTSDWDAQAAALYGLKAGSIHDEWMVNYTSEYVVATWSGYKQPNSINNTVLYMNIPGQINRHLLDLMVSKSYPAEISQPDGISTITHVKGAFPYASSPEGLSSDMVTSGKIKTEFNKLTTLSAEDLKDISSFTASAKEDANNLGVHLNFASYPDSDKTQEAAHSKTFEVLGISFTGNVFYDPSFVFGKVVYKADVKLNGNVVQTISTSDAESDQSLSGVSPGDTIDICGYYAYEKDGKKSNEICTSVTLPKKAEVKVDKSSLQAAINNANNYKDPAKYKQPFIDQLNNSLNTANAILAKADATQDEINAQTVAVNAAIQQCIQNPVDTNQNQNQNQPPQQ